MAAREAAVRSAFVKQSSACLALGSPFMARLCGLLASRLDRATAVGRAVLDWPQDPVSDALALRLAGGFHALCLSGRNNRLAAVYPPHEATDAQVWERVGDCIAVDDRFLLDWITSPPQTNEVGRSCVFLPGFLAIARRTRLPLVISELGASAGLNLGWESYAYDFGAWTFGRSSSPIRLTAEWRGPPPAPVAPEVAGRAGCDLRPLDAGRGCDRLRALSYVWADQADRLARTRQALDLAASRPERVAEADAADWLGERFALQRHGHVHVICHSIVWQSLPAVTRERIENAILSAGSRASEQAPIAWLRFEPDDRAPGAALRLSVWPAGETRLLARADFHGRWVEWLGDR